jgi:hypothetical protein
MPKIARIFAIFLSLLLACAHAASARPVVLFPPNYNAQYAYPVVFFLPPLGGTAEEVVQFLLAKDGEPAGSTQAMFEKWLRRAFALPQDLQKSAFILALVEGEGSLAQGFDTLLAQTEKKLGKISRP